MKHFNWTTHPDQHRRPLVIGLLSLGTAVVFHLLMISSASHAATDFQGSLKGVSITDSAGTNQPPVAKITYTQDADTFTFDASESYDPDGNIIEYEWDFGDGTKKTGALVSHQYADITSASVSLTLLDNSKAVTIYQQLIEPGNISGTCQNADVSYVSLANNTPDIFQDIAHGQSFMPNTTGEIYSIKVNTMFLPNPSLATLMIRVGDTADLSTTYETEEIVSLADYVAGDTVEIVFTTKPTMTAGVTKYFMIFNTGDFSTRFKLYRNNTSGYAGGTEYSSSAGLDNIAAGSGDLSFEVMTCD